MTQDEVIRGLECCISGNPAICKRVGCPYAEEHDGIGDTCIDHLMADALALLREQEPVAPVLQSGGNYVCGACGVYTVGFMHPLTGESVQTWKYCGSCGKKVRWE